MVVDVEETLSRELREVVDGLHIPAMPSLDEAAPPRTKGHWQPPLVAAAVVAIVTGAVAVGVVTRDGQDRLPERPSASQTAPVVTIPTTPPTVPYLLNKRLYVDGERLPGTWWRVYVGDDGWLAARTDDTWWWGRGSTPNEIPGYHDTPPDISPNGRYVAEIHKEDGERVLTALDTRSGGEGLGSLPVKIRDRGDGTTVGILAVTNDGKVITQRSNTRMMWLPLVDNGTVDVPASGPGQAILDNTSAGLILTDDVFALPGDASGEPYLAEISDTGELTRIRTIPAHDVVVVSPGAEWLAWVTPGTLGGEVTEVGSLEAQRVDGTRHATMNAPAGWGFPVHAWVWEDDDYLVAQVVRNGTDFGEQSYGRPPPVERMARCSPQLARCVLIDTN